MAKRRLEVIIAGDASGLKRALGSSNRDVDKFGKSVATMGNASKRGFGSAIGGAVRLAATTTGLLGVAAAITKIGTATIGFDRAMRNVNSIAQLSEKQLQSLEKQVLRLAGKTAQSPQKLAEGLYDLVSSGFNAKQSMVVLSSSAKAATAGLTTTEVSTKAVAAVLNAYRLKASDAAEVSDILFQTVNRGVVTFDELSTTIGDVLPYAAQLHVPLRDVGAAISTMTKEGLSGSEATVRLKNAMIQFIKPGKDMAAAIQLTGAKSGESLIKTKGFQGAVEAVLKTGNGSKEDLASLFKNIRAIGGALALTGINAKGAHDDLAAFKDVTGATDKALAQQSKSISYKWNHIKAVMGAVAISVGNVVVPAFAAGLDTIVGWAGKVGDAVDAIKSKFDSLTKTPKLPQGMSGTNARLLEGAIPKHKSALSAIGIMVADGIKSIDWAGIGNTLGAGISRVFGATGKLPALISQGLGAAFSAVNGEQVLGKLLDVIGQAVDALFSPSFWIKHFAAIFSVVTLVIPVGKILKIPGAAFLFKWISKPFIGALATLGRWLLTGFGRVAVRAGEGLLSGLADTFPKTVTTIVLLAKTLPKYLASLPGRLGGIAGKAGGTVAARLLGAAGKMGEAVGKWIGRMVGAFGSAPKRLLAAAWKVIQAVIGPFHDAGARFFELGKNLIQGLINGVLSKAKDAVNAVGDVAKGAFDKAKGVLGIGSPSKLFHWVGEQIVSGLVNGLTNGKDAVAHAAYKGLLFPLEAAIAKLEAKRDALQAKFDAQDKAAEKRGLLADLRKARKEPIFTSSGGTSSTGGSGPPVVAGGHFLQGLGLSVGESKYFGGVTTNRHAHYKNDHYSGNSIDVNAAGGGSGELSKLKAALAKIRAKFGSMIQMALIEDAGSANQHLHVTFKATAAAVKGGLKNAAAKTTGKLNANQIRGLAYAAGFRGHDLDVAVAIALAESRGRVNAKHTNRDGSIDRGLFQINSVHGAMSTTNATKNAASAFALYKARGGFGDWVTYNSGAYKSHLGNVGSGKGSASAGFKFNTGRAGDIGSAVKALKDFNTEAKRTKALAKIELKIKGIQQLKDWKDALDGIASDLKGKVSDAADAFAQKWEDTVGKALDKTNAAALDAFDRDTDSLVANGPAAQALAQLQAQSDAIAAAAEDASNQQALEDAKRSGDPRQIAAAQAAIQETARQRAITVAQAAADNERTAIEAQRANDRTAMEDQQAADRQKGLDDDTAAFKAKLTADLDAEYAVLKARGENYASFVNNVNKILNRIGDGSTDNSYTPDASAEAAINAGPKTAPSLVSQIFGKPGPNPSSVFGKPKGHAAGGGMDYGRVYRVGELGPENIVRTPGGVRVVPASESNGRGAWNGPLIDNNGGVINIGNQRSAEVLANRYAYRAAFG